TDYLAIVDLLKQRTSLKGKSVVVLGTGSTARAMVYVSILQCAFVTLLGRPQEKAESLADEFSCAGDSLENIQHYRADILMNGTSVGMTGNDSSRSSIVPKNFLQKNMVILDAVYAPPMTALLRQAKAAGCIVISGKELFEKQA